MSLICIFAYPARRSCARAGLPAPRNLPCRFHSPVLFTGRTRRVFPHTVSPAYYRMTRSHVIDLLFWKRSRELFTFTSDFVKWRSTALWVLERRRARRSRSVCCERSFGDSRWEWEWVTEWYDWRRPGASSLSRFTVFFATLWHCRELSDERYADHIQFKYWLLRRLTPGITDRSPPDLRRQQSVFVAVVYYAVATTHLLLCTCCLLLATSFGWHSRCTLY